MNIYNLNNTYGIGYASNTGNEFYFDLKDYDIIKNYCWYEETKRYGYLVNKSEHNFIIMHRFIMGCTDPNIKIDHINHNTKDNRRQNLRFCTQQENMRNQKISKANKSGVIGVSYFNDRNKWCPCIGVNNKVIKLGNYKDKNEAIKVRLQAEKDIFGEFAPQKYLFKKYGIK